MNQKLKEIGEKLNLKEKDIWRIQKGFISKKVLGIIVGIAIAILAFILWLILRRQTGLKPSTPPPSTPLPPGYPYTPQPPKPGEGYPFVPPAMIGGYLLTKKRNSKVAGFLVSAIVFLSSLMPYPAFGQAIMYNVYKKKSLKDFFIALAVTPVFGQAIKYSVYSKK